MTRRPTALYVAAVVALGCAVLGLLASGSARPLNPDGVHELVLDNGVRVLAYPRGDDPPTASVQVWIAAGSADEPAEKAGLAHFFEHMVFGGTDTLAVGEFERRIEAMGGDLNATTGPDFTSYEVSVPSAHVEEVIALLGEVTTRPAFPEEMFESEREVIYREQEFRGDDPERAAFEQLAAILFDPHPYARPVGGTRETVAAITREDMFAFVEEHYVPERMTLVVVGDIDPERVFQAARDAFGSVPRRPAPVRDNPPLPPLDPARISVRETRDLEQTYLMLGWRAPSARDEDGLALDLVQALLGRGRSARLEQRVRRDLGLVSGISAEYTALRDHGVFTVFAQMTPGNEAAVEEAIWEEIGLIQRGEFTDRELERARNLLLADYLFGLQSHEDVMMALGYAQTVAGDWRRVFTDLDALRAVTAGDVAAAARRYLSREGAARVIIGPERAAADAPLPALDPDSTEPQRFVLDNGHVFIVQNRPHASVIAVETVARAGRLDEPPGKAGLAALTSRLVLKGTADMQEDAFYTRVEELGGRISGESGADLTRVSLLSLPESFEELLTLYADMVQQLSFTPDDLEKERELLRRDLEANLDSFFSVALESFYEALYGDHPYGAGTEAQLAALDSITAEDVRAFHRTFFAPNNLVTAVVGPVNPVEVQALLAKAFGSRPARPVPDPNPPAVEPPEGPVDVALEGDTQAGWLIVGFPAPATTADNHAAQRMLRAIVGEGFSSLLFQEVRNRLSLTYATSALLPRRRDANAFAVYAVTPPTREAVDAATEAIYRVVTEHIARVDDELMELAREMVVGRFARARETPGDQASLLAEFEALGLGYEQVGRYPDLIRAVSRDDILAAAEEIFKKEHAVRAFVLPPQQ